MKVNVRSKERIIKKEKKEINSKMKNIMWRWRNRNNVLAHQKVVCRKKYYFSWKINILSTLRNNIWKCHSGTVVTCLVLTYYRVVKANRGAHLIPQWHEIREYFNFFTYHRLHSKQIAPASYIVLLQRTGTFQKCRNLSSNILWKIRIIFFSCRYKF